MKTADLNAPATDTLNSAKFFSRAMGVNQPLTTTANNAWYRPEGDVALYFTSDQGDFAIIGDDSLVTDDEIFGLFEGEVPAGWVAVSY